MLSPDSFPSQTRDADDSLWRKAEDLIERLDRRSHDCGDESNFEQEVVDALRQFSAASGVSIQKQSKQESLLIAKSGISVFQMDPFEIDDSGRSLQQDLSEGKRLEVTRPITATDKLSMQLCFDQRPTAQEVRVFTEASRALTDILLPVILRREISSLSNSLQRVSSDHQFIESFFAGSTVNETYRSIAKTLATLTHIDRVSIVLPTRSAGNTGRLVATSVPTDIDPRAQQAKTLGHLAQNVQSRAQYAKRYDVQQLHIEEVTGSNEQIIAWIVFEQYAKSGDEANSTSLQNPLRNPLQNSAQCSFDCAVQFAPYRDLTQRAVQNAVARDLATPDSISKIFASFTLARWATIAAVFGVVFLALWFVKIPMRLSVPGRITATSRITKHSPANGFVTKVHVADGDLVTAGTKLVELHSPELELVAQRLSSELTTTMTKIDSLQSLKRGDAASQTSAQWMVLKTEADGIRRQLELVRLEQESLILRSTGDGIVRQWDAQETLAGRVVVIGQPLLEVIDPSAGWTVELDIPDDQIGYVIEHDIAQPACTFRVLSSPTQVHRGCVDHIDRAAQLSEKGQSIVRANISIDPDRADGFRRGASVVAKVDCGPRSASFVLFRGLVQWWRSQGWV